jgi:hypothetical protein
VFVEGKAALSVFFKFCDRLTIEPARSWREEFGARSNNIGDVFKFLPTFVQHDSTER